MHQAENRMTTSNLAVCFGVVFIPPSQTDDLDTAQANGMRLHIEIMKYMLDIWPQHVNINNNIVI